MWFHNWPLFGAQNQQFWKVTVHFWLNSQSLNDYATNPYLKLCHHKHLACICENPPSLTQEQKHIQKLHYIFNLLWAKYFHLIPATNCERDIVSIFYSRGDQGSGRSSTVIKATRWHNSFLLFCKDCIYRQTSSPSFTFCSSPSPTIRKIWLCFLPISSNVSFTVLFMALFQKISWMSRTREMNTDNSNRLQGGGGGMQNFFSHAEE